MEMLAVVYPLKRFVHELSHRRASAPGRTEPANQEERTKCALGRTDCAPLLKYAARKRAYSLRKDIVP
jgi:hypothetical protein